MSRRRARETDTTVYVEPGTEKRRFVSKARRVRRTYEIDTREVIEKAIKRLMELAEEAHKRATSKYQPTEARQKWVSIEAYIYQTINSLTKTYDSQQVMEKLEELERIVEELMEEGQEPGEED